MGSVKIKKKCSKCSKWKDPERICLAIAVGVIAIAIGFAIYMGYFHTPHPVYKEQSPLFCVLKNRRIKYGDEEELAFEKLHQLLSHTNLLKTTHLNWISMYYDDPDGVLDERETRYTYGYCSIDEGITDNIYQKVKKEEFKRYNLPRINIVEFKFPYKNHLSFMLGRYKIYPELRKAVLSNIYFNKRIRRECAFPDCSLPSLLIGSTDILNMNQLIYFFPLGDGYKDFAINNLTMPTYTTRKFEEYRKFKLSL